jgi:phenylacetate-CoA ligase
MPLADHMMHTKIMEYYQLIKKMQTWSKDDISNWQNRKLKKLIKYAYCNTYYYNKVFDENRINVSDIETIEDLKKIPTLTKQDVINNYDKLISKNISQIHYKKSSTGGSTGDPMNFLLDNDSWSFTNGNNIYNWEKTEYQYGNKYIALGSTSLFVNKSVSLKHKIYYILKGKIGLNGINMSNEVCAKYLKFIKKDKIKFIYGYASAIYLLAKYAIQNNINVEISACFPTSEILTDVYRQAIIEAFSCDIINSYGAHDGGITAFEYKKGYFDVGYNTIITIKEKDKNNTGLALLTDLFNYAMPLINYQLGDELQKDDDKNKNYSYNGQVINYVYGRTSDVIRLENGNILTGPGFTILFKDLPVKAYRIKNESGNSLVCEIVKDNKYEDEHEKVILNSLTKQAGKSVAIKIKYFDIFNLKNSGKRDYFISE